MAWQYECIVPVIHKDIENTKNVNIKSTLLDDATDVTGLGVKILLPTSYSV